MAAGQPRGMNIPSNAKCPKCGTVLASVTAGHVQINVPGGKAYHGLTYACPSCQVLLSIQMDPTALNIDIVDALFDKLRK
jgi:hypothetical protein